VGGWGAYTLELLTREAVTLELGDTHPPWILAFSYTLKRILLKKVSRIFFLSQLVSVLGFFFLISISTVSKSSELRMLYAAQKKY
jgi:hypothetical protein